MSDSLEREVLKNSNSARVTFLVCVAIFIFSILFFSFRLLEVPRGITMDEAAFGYNAALISETLRDENGRFLPVFVLSLDGQDWRQPVAQYLQVGAFKVFGKSLFILKFVSVLVAAVSVVIIFLLGSQMLGKKFGLLAFLIFITTPVIMIHSHLALDNIMPVPFILLWLFGVYKFQKEKSIKYLILSGISLGISFYAHKSMRSAAPVWTLLTMIYLIHQSNWRVFNLKKYKPVILFLVSIIPFYLISPILEYKYAGAVYGTQAISLASIYEFIYYYLSSFDPSFLFIRGDSILHHSTGIHGMFLLATLPIFIYGLYKSFQQRNPFLVFIITCLFTGPLFFGFIGSIHRASRLIFLVPLFSLITAFGLVKLFEVKRRIFKSALVIFCILFAANFFDFLSYYWFKYAGDTSHIFYSTSNINAYKELNEISKKKNLNPFISKSLMDLNGNAGAVEDFSRSLYFVKPNVFEENSRLPSKSILLTNDMSYQWGEKMESTEKNYFLYINY